MNARSSPRRGYGMIGLLITLVCMVVLFVIGMNAVNTAVTGQGSAKINTVRSFEDKLQLSALYQSMLVGALENKDRYLVPSELSGSDDPAQNTTANLFSAMIARHYTGPEQLISGNEYNPYVWPDEDYDITAYNPAGGTFWDPRFVADLEDESNVSYAHVPLYGERVRREWRANLRSDFPLLGNRGPKDGIEDPDSWTYGRDRTWAGHLVFGDGHVQFVNTFTPAGVFYEQDGRQYNDNIFAMEEGPNGRDAILSFTRKVSTNGPVLQYD